MRLALAILCWIVHISAAAWTLYHGSLLVFPLSVALGILYAVWNVRQGRKWYGVFLLLVPLYGWWLTGKMYWSWAGTWSQTLAKPSVVDAGM
jgi:hypothetical protein